MNTTHRKVRRVNRNLPTRFRWLWARARIAGSENPGYAAWQHYPDATRWAEATLRRLKSWGFTTIGGWSDFKTVRQCRESDAAFMDLLQCDFAIPCVRGSCNVAFSSWHYVSSFA